MLQIYELRSYTTPFVFNRTHKSVVTYRLSFMYGALLLAVVLAFTFLHLPGNTLFWQALQNSGHAVVFGTLAVIALDLMVRLKNVSLCKSIASVSFGLTVMGLVIELAQQATGRGASVHDMVLNLAGVISGCCLYAGVRAFWRSGVHRGRAVMFLVTGVATMMWSLQWPVIYFVFGFQRPQIPNLADFENRGAQLFISGTGTTFDVAQHSEWTENQSRSLRAQYEPGHWHNIYLVEPEEDWSTFNHLTFRVFNPSKSEVTISVRIDDRSLGDLDDDHMTLKQQVPTGSSQVVLGFDQFKADALKRTRPGKATFKEIHGFMVFLGRTKHSTTLYFDDFRLR